MNDPSEILHGIAAAKNQLTTIFKDGLGEEKAEKFAQKFFEQSLKKIKMTANFFICCFSKNGDELGQWRAYGDDGHGYALGFHGDLLDKSFISDDAIHNSSIKISYNEELLDARQKGSTNILYNYLSRKIKKLLTLDDWIEHVMNALMISLLHKHWGYTNEDEYRFLQIFPIDKTPSNLKYRLRINKKRDHNLVSYREFLWDRKLLKEIIIGPASNPENAKTFVEKCLAAYGYNLSDIKIRMSEIPYRS
jgi:hypothetical protein